MNRPEDNDWMTALDADIVRKVLEFDWALVGVGAGSGLPSYAYTVGFWKTFRHPELVVVGLPQNIASDVLANCADLIRDGAKFTDGDLAEGIFGGTRARFRNTVDGWVVGFGVSNRFYGRAVPRLQLVWPDVEGRFPGDPDCAPGVIRLQEIG